MYSDMHDEAGHLTGLGWTMFALYLVAALLSFRAAATLVRSPQSAVSSMPACSTRCVWIWFGIVLAALGVNKPLNLQTWLIELGRQIANKEHLMAHRNELFALFFAGFTLAIIALLVTIVFRWRELIVRFARQSPLALGGFGLICAYIVIRAADIDHVDETMGFDLERIPFLWLLEAGGLLLIITESLHAGFKKPKS